MSTPAHWFGAAFAFACIAAAAASCANGASVTGLDCTSTETICDTVCADLKNDSENCGKCGNECATAQLCVNGVCAIECPSGDTVCGGGDGGKSGRCVNTKSDNANCGGCGHACPGGQICYQGICNGTCGDPKLGQSVCTSDGGTPFCANTKSDNQNCGKCGTACGAEQVCVSGVCQGDCSPDQTMCGGEGGPLYCANTQSDNANCGACGAVCGLLQGCSGGQCVSQCDETQTICTSGSQSFCADTASDNTNCGTCGNVCPSNKPICQGGTCGDGSCNRTALVLGDTDATSNTAIKNAMQAAGFTVTLVSDATTNYSGSPAASGFGVVFIGPGTDYSTDMPSAGQTSIVNAHNAGKGTGVIFTEWSGFEVYSGRFNTLKQINILDYSGYYFGAQDYTLKISGHPIWNGVPSSFTTSVSIACTVQGTLKNSGVLLASSTNCTTGVAIADPSSAGRVVDFAEAGVYSGSLWYNDSRMTTLIGNAALWAARCD